MREAAARLLARDRIGRDVFLRGAPEGLRIDRKTLWQCEWYDLVSAYAQVKARNEPVVHMVRDRMVMTLETAIERVSALLGVRLDWIELRDFLPAHADRAAPAFGARVELCRRARARAARQGGDPAGGHVRSAALAAGAGMTRPDELVRAVEATLFASEEPLTVEQLSTHLGGADVREALATLEVHYADRGVRLVERGKRWQFQTAPDLAHLLRREREQVRKLSRAATEVLAIIAYHEPVSRAEIESIRGVQTSPGTLDVLMEAGWVRVAGRREVPGRPVIYATTPEFLSHFGLASRKDLPGIDELKAAGLLDPVDEAFDEMVGRTGPEAGQDDPEDAEPLENPEQSA